MAVQIPAAHRDALVTKVGTFVPLGNPWWTTAAPLLSAAILSAHKSARLTLLAVRVLQAETGFVTFCHSGAVGVEQVVVGEDVHAVVMAAKGTTDLQHVPPLRPA